MAMEFKADLDEFHSLVDGRLVAIHDMLNTIGVCTDAMYLCAYVRVRPSAHWSYAESGCCKDVFVCVACAPMFAPYFWNVHSPDKLPRSGYERSDGQLQAAAPAPRGRLPR